ncbi:MAG: hypothetical protein IT371_30575 [Deltaproteobacteria bacterium]|nr:hypothetical protein [Deltaproteobacteria bacterium]
MATEQQKINYTKVVLWLEQSWRGLPPDVVTNQVATLRESLSKDRWEDASAGLLTGIVVTDSTYFSQPVLLTKLNTIQRDNMARKPPRVDGKPRINPTARTSPSPVAAGAATFAEEARKDVTKFAGKAGGAIERTGQGAKLLLENLDKVIIGGVVLFVAVQVYSAYRASRR